MGPPYSGEYNVRYKLLWFTSLLILSQFLFAENQCDYAFDTKILYDNGRERSHPAAGNNGYLSKIYSNKKIKVTLERRDMENRTANWGRSVQGAKSSPELLGSSLVSKGKQEWKVLTSEWKQ